MVVLLLALPLFGEARGERVMMVALPALRDLSVGILYTAYGFVIANALLGVAELALQNLRHQAWLRVNTPVSLALSALSVFFFIMTRQPYVSSFLLCLLLLKGNLLLKLR
jgi:hypothetical protein